MTDAQKVLLLGSAPWLTRRDYPKLVNGLQAWFDETDPDSMIYDSSNRVALISDKSGNSGTGSGRSSGLFFTGVATQAASAPDSVALSITGDLDLRCYARLLDWTPAADSFLVGKWDSTGDQRSYWLSVFTDGTLKFTQSTTGTAGTSTTSYSTVATGISDNAAKWVRVTLDVDNGAAGRTITFYTSDDGVTWVQLGSAVVVGTAATTFDGTAVVTVGASNAGAFSIPKGVIYRAQIYNGIAGTLVFDANFVGQRTNATSFTESSSNAATVTINGTALLGWVDSANALCLNGVAGNYASAPDSVPLSVTGDIDIRVDCTLFDWTPAGIYYFVSKWVTTGGQRSYVFGVLADGTLELSWSADGATAIQKLSTAATGNADLSRGRVRATLDVDDGAGNNVVTFYTSSDGVTWTQLGAAVTTAGTTSVFNSNADLNIGRLNAGTNIVVGNIYRAQIYNGIAGTLAFDANFATCPKLASSFIESSTNAAVVTINTSGAQGARISGARDRYQGTAASQQVRLPHSGTNYGYLNGVTGNYFSSPDSAAVSITGDIDIRAYAALSSWASGAVQSLVSKNAAGTNRQYYLSIGATGFPGLTLSLDGSAETGATSTAATGLAAFAASWLRATWRASDGRVQFFTSTDGDSWTQLGTDRTLAIASIYDGTAAINVGARVNGNSEPCAGYIYRAQIYNGIAGTLAFDFNPAAYTSGTTFLDSSSNAATITINAGAMIVTRSGLYSEGVDDYSKTPSFNLPQPATGVMLVEQVTWTSTDCLWAGNVNGAGVLAQDTTTPGISVYPGTTAGAVNSALPLRTAGVTFGIVSGTSSETQVGRGTATTGGTGTTAMNGFTVAANGNGSTGYANAFTSEEFLYSVALTTSDRARLALWSARKHRLPAV